MILATYRWRALCYQGSLVSEVGVACLRISISWGGYTCFGIFQGLAAIHDFGLYLYPC